MNIIETHNEMFNTFQKYYMYETSKTVPMENINITNISIDLGEVHHLPLTKLSVNIWMPFGNHFVFIKTPEFFRCINENTILDDNTVNYYYDYEVTKAVAHGPQSVIFDEAENRMWAQIAIMVTLSK